MSIVRIQKTKNYSVIANQPINDHNLSWGARGMLAYLLSKPNHWQVRMTEAARNAVLADLVRYLDAPQERKAKEVADMIRECNGQKYGWRKSAA